MAKPRRENDRYVHASLREQLTGALRSWRSHKMALGVAAIILAGGLALAVMTPSHVRIGDLRAGDCLYVPMGKDDLQADVGLEADVLLVLYFQGAERAPCTASHGHEVLATWTYPEPAGTPWPGRDALVAGRAAACTSAFADYVGRPHDGSALTFTVGVPDEPRWTAGSRVGICLLYQRDRAFLTSPARGGNR